MTKGGWLAAAYISGCMLYGMWTIVDVFVNNHEYKTVLKLASPDGTHRLLVQKVYLSGFPGGTLDEWADLSLENADGSGRTLVVHSSVDITHLAWMDATHVRVVLDNQTVLHDRKDDIGVISFAYLFEPNNPAARRAALEKLKIPKDLWRENGVKP